MKLFNSNIFASGKASKLQWLPAKKTFRLMADRRHGINGMAVWMDIIKNSTENDGMERLLVDVKKNCVEIREAY